MTAANMTKSICIFELPANWDQGNLPPTVVGGGSRHHRDTVADKNDGGRSTMWSKAYITTSCNMGSDLSSLGLDVEELDNDIGMEKLECDQGVIRSYVQRHQEHRRRQRRSRRRRRRMAHWVMMGLLCHKRRRSTNNSDIDHENNKDDSSVDTVATYRWSSPSTSSPPGSRARSNVASYCSTTRSAGGRSSR